MQDIFISSAHVKLFWLSACATAHLTIWSHTMCKPLTWKLLFTGWLWEALHWITSASRAHRNMIFDTTDLANIEPFRYITWSRVALGWVCSYLMYIIYKKIMNNWLIPERKHVLCCCLDLYGFPLLSLCCDKAKCKIWLNITYCV